MTSSVLSWGLRSVLLALPLLSLPTFGAGCVRRTAVVEFPTLQALRRIAAQPAAPARLSAGANPAAGWTVEAGQAALGRPAARVLSRRQLWRI